MYYNILHCFIVELAHHSTQAENGRYPFWTWSTNRKSTSQRLGA